MLLSKDIIGFIKSYESLHDGGYRDNRITPKLDPAGIWTEGYGSVLYNNGERATYENTGIQEAIQLSKIETEREAYSQLVSVVFSFAKGVTSRLKVKQYQWQFDALLSHAYNCGYSDTMYARINGRASDYKIFEWFVNHYITSGGVYMKGLKSRRIDEWLIYSGSNCNYERHYYEKSPYIPEK